MQRLRIFYWLLTTGYCLLTTSLAVPVADTIIDRVLAVVSGRVITLSDVRGALGLGLVNVAGATDQLGAALDQLIERELILAEVERYVPPEPDPDAIEERTVLVRRRFPHPDAFADVLREAGWTEEQLRGMIRDDLRIQAYLGQRFAVPAEPTDAEVAAYYREHAADFTRDGRLPPLVSIAEVVRERLIAERRRTVIAAWVTGLRQRAEIAVLYLPGRQ